MMYCCFFSPFLFLFLDQYHQLSQRMFMTPRFLLMMSLCLSFGLPVLYDPSLSWEYKILFGSLLSSSLFKWPAHLGFGEYIIYTWEFRFLHEEFICNMLPPLIFKYFAKVMHPLGMKTMGTLFVYRPWFCIILKSSTLHIQFLWRNLCWARHVSSAHQRLLKYCNIMVEGFCFIYLAFGFS